MATANIRARLGLDSMPYKAGARDVSRQNEAMKRGIMQIGAAIGVSFGIAGIMRGVRALSEYASQASIAARNTGLLTHEFVALNRVGIQAGVQTRQMEQMMGRMQTELFNAARGSAEAARKFEQMGLDIDDLVRMRPADMLEAVAKAAFETGVPIGNLADLFGQRLGPQAVTALRNIAENGLPEVDRALGDTMDQIEAMGSKWTEIWDKTKSGFISFASWLDQKHSRLTDRLGGMLASVGEAGLRRRKDEGADMGLRGTWEAGGEQVDAGARQREAELEKRLEQREKQIAESTQGMIDLTEQSRIDAEKTIAAAAATRIQTTEENEREANERMIRQRMEGEDKLHADAMASYNEALKGYEQAESDTMRGIFRQRMELVNEYYDLDLQAHRDAEAEKLNREQQRHQDSIDRMHERMERERDQATGTGIMADQLARIGGFMGGERAGIAQADKQLRIAEISERHLAEIAVAINDLSNHEVRESGGGI